MGQLVCQAVEFDGTNDCLIGSPLPADSKKGILSAWIKLNGNDGELMIFMRCGGASNVGISFNRSAAGKFQIVGNGSGGEKLRIGTNANFAAGAAWYHILADWDLADSAKRHLQVNRASDLVVTTYLDALVDNDGAAYGIGSNNVGSSRTAFAIAELYYAAGQWLDTSADANADKFADTFGGTLHPVDMGSNGATPTGTAPSIYLTSRTGDPASFFAKERGISNGLWSFTLTGTLVVAATAP